MTRITSGARSREHELSAAVNPSRYDNTAGKSERAGKNKEGLARELTPSVTDCE